MTQDFGKGFTVTNLKYMRQFYLMFPNGHALRDELSWTHYRLLIKVENDNAREFYMQEAVKSQWSTRQLERHIWGLCHSWPQCWRVQGSPGHRSGWERKLQILALCPERLKKPRRKGHPDPVCRRSVRDEGGHSSCIPKDRVPALYRPSGQKHHEVSKKWTMLIRNWGQVYGEVSIMYEGRLPEWVPSKRVIWQAISPPAIYLLLYIIHGLVL